MLEPYEGKLSRAVLRGEGGSNTPDLPDDQAAKAAQIQEHGSVGESACLIRRRSAVRFRLFLL